MDANLNNHIQIKIRRAKGPLACQTLSNILFLVVVLLVLSS